ncbi:hypothetical protein K461DRAFT_82488 [Myriangium duriaei CBS 260.36]|uniref:Uncharacterized protein n=1 Tax=Myriangium duriaei CBS 260.36 TaxID=1168546 RepID=A0A9P4J847_9PEZI|nr:hypothetical protein K461DRAFT_82488 [Myriangium duriaei CBS 260.36]
MAGGVPVPCFSFFFCCCFCVLPQLLLRCSSFLCLFRPRRSPHFRRHPLARMTNHRLLWCFYVASIALLRPCSRFDGVLPAQRLVDWSHSDGGLPFLCANLPPQPDNAASLRSVASLDPNNILERDIDILRPWSPALFRRYFSFYTLSCG